MEWIGNKIVDDSELAPAFEAWRRIVEGTPRIAHEKFYWSPEEGKLGVGLGI